MVSMTNDAKDYRKSRVACARTHPALFQPSAPVTVTSQLQELW